MGRFINADSYASTGQGILGDNMFAYCKNNPTNMVDVNGNWPKWLDDFADWIDNATEDFVEKSEDVLEAGWKSLEVSAGIGLGLFAGVGVLDDFLGIELGMYYDVFNISLADGSFSVQEYGYVGASVSVLIPVWEHKEERYRPYGQNTSEWSDLDQATAAVPLLGTGAYLFGGGNYSIGFDFGKFFRMVDEIF